MKHLLILLLCMISGSCFAIDENDTLTVIDSKTKAGIGFATIYVQHHDDWGTIANMNGKFRLKNIEVGDTIIISSIGYDSTRSIIRNENGKKIFELSPSIYTLPEIIVKKENFKAYMKSIWKSIANNSPDPYPILDGLYRQQIAVDGHLASASECDMLMKEFPYKKNHINTFVAANGRKQYVNPKYEFVKDLTYAIVPAGSPNIYEINPDAYNEYIYSIEKSYKDNDGNVITEISFTRKDSTGIGYIYFNETNLAILKFHFTRNVSSHEANGFSESVNNIKYTWDNTYQTYMDKYIHSYCRVEFEYNIINKKTNQIIHKINSVIDYKTNNILGNNWGEDKILFQKPDISPFKDKDDIIPCNLNELKGIVTDYK